MTFPRWEWVPRCYGNISKLNIQPSLSTTLVKRCLKFKDSFCTEDSRAQSTVSEHITAASLRVNIQSIQPLAHCLPPRRIFYAPQSPRWLRYTQTVHFTTTVVNLANSTTQVQAPGAPIGDGRPMPGPRIASRNEPEKATAP